ncbi:MAG: SsrA-binding protein, partial [Anaerohalosphaera sp.]|nr:SsrA-binding protein [Anaerohalosphaera sp.]
MATDKKKKSRSGSINVKNRKAYHDYELVEKVEAGLVLYGTEVKSIRQGLADLEGSYARIIHNECLLVGCKIAHYAQASYNNHEPLRDRKLLLHRRQIEKIKIK